jgi:hypothetical protein
MGKLVGGITDAIGLTDIKGTEKRAQELAESQRQAAQQGAIASAFRPVGMTSNFGTSQFGLETIGGVPRVTSASYQLSPELQALQNALFGLTGGGLDTAQQAQQAAAPLGQAAQGLFGLGSQYLAMSPEEARQQFMQEQYALLDPIRAREEQRLGASVFGRGRAGLNIGDMGQPELFALASARRGQDLDLAARAEQAAQQRAQFGSGLFGTGAQLLGQQYGIPTQALGPLQSYLGTIGSIEEMGQDPFRLGLAVGGAAQPGAQAGANLLTAGQQAAAQTQFQGQQAASNQLTGFMNNLLGAAVGGFTGASGGLSSGISGLSSGIGNLFGNPLTSLQYGTNLGSQQTSMLANQNAWF